MQKLLSWFDTLTWTDSTNSNLTAHDMYVECCCCWIGIETYNPAILTEF